MIVFDLKCECGIQFEGWFRDSEDFLRQQDENLLRCSECGSHNVRKILSPVAVRSAGRSQSAADLPDIPDENTVARALKSLQDYVIKNYEDVGAKLAEESLKMHYGVSEPRNIRGVSTEEEEKTLKEEGIEIVKVPLPVNADKELN